MHVYCNEPAVINPFVRYVVDVLSVFRRKIPDDAKNRAAVGVRLFWIGIMHTGMFSTFRTSRTKSVNYFFCNIAHVCIPYDVIVDVKNKQHCATVDFRSRDRVTDTRVWQVEVR